MKGVYEKQVEKYLIDFFEHVESSETQEILELFKKEDDFKTWWRVHIIDAINYKFKNNKISYGEIEYVVSQAIFHREVFFKKILRTNQINLTLFFEDTKYLYKEILYCGALDKTKDCKDFKDLENFIKKLKNEKEKDIQKSL